LFVRGQTFLGIVPNFRLQWAGAFGRGVFGKVYVALGRGRVLRLTCKLYQIWVLVLFFRRVIVGKVYVALGRGRVLRLAFKVHMIGVFFDLFDERVVVG